MEALFVLLTALGRMSPELQSYLKKILKRSKFKKGTVVLKEGQICRRIYFLEGGLIRIYHRWNGIEVTTWLLKEGDIFIAPQSFFSQEPSQEEIVVVEDCVCWSISYSELDEVCRKFPEFCWHRIIITQNYYVLNLKMNNSMRRQTSMEKYSRLMETAPDLLQRVPMKYIYSYLGMSKATFERTREEYASHKK